MRPPSSPARRRLLPLVGASVLALVATAAYGATVNVQVTDRTGYAVGTTDEGAIVEYIGDLNTTFGSSGSGIFDSFVRIQNDDDEKGYNTDGDREFDTKAGAFTHSVLVSEIPVVECESLNGAVDPAGLCWELFADLNESDSTKLISLDALEIYFTTEGTAVNDDPDGPDLTGYPFGGNTTKVFDSDDQVLINDVNQGSGRGDLRYLVPLTGVTIPLGCGYGSTTCATYFVLYSEYGFTDGSFDSDGGFEEWKVKIYPTLRIDKATVGGDATFGFTVTGPTASTPSITTSGGTGTTGTLAVDPGTYTITESTIPASWSLEGATCSFNGDTPTAYIPGANLVIEEDDHVVCTFTNEKAGQIIVDKVTDPAADPQLFDFNASWDAGAAPDFQLADATTPHNSGDLDPGTYSVAETVPAGWDLTSATCDDGSAVGSISLQAGETVTCTFTNQKDAVIIVDKVTDPAADPQLFDFNASWDAGAAPDFQLADATTPHNSGDLDPGTYSVAETVPAGWDLTSATCDDGSAVGSISLQAGETVTCTFTNTKRGEVEVVKTVSGGAPGGLTFTFQIRTGASATEAGTVVASTTTDPVTGLADFGGATFAPGTYQFCEANMLPGWDTSLDDGGFGTAFVPDSDDPLHDNSVVCVNFTLSAGETETFSINNNPPPGGDARTIGFWRNWSSCTGGNQDPVLDDTLASFDDPDGLGPLPAGGVLIGDIYVDTCAEAVSILSKSKLAGTKMASDAAYGLAAQLLAAELNYEAGAGQCAAATSAIAGGQALLDSIGFNATGNYLGPKVKGAAATTRQQALNYAATLDAYNNNSLCP